MRQFSPLLFHPQSLSVAECVGSEVHPPTSEFMANSRIVVLKSCLEAAKRELDLRLQQASDLE
eukprot:11439361-Prorocentrum_lima.AAC.1